MILNSLPIPSMGGGSLPGNVMELRTEGFGDNLHVYLVVCPALAFYNDMGDPGFGYYTKAYTVSGTTVTLKNKGASEMIYGIMGTIA